MLHKVTHMYAFKLHKAPLHVVHIGDGESQLVQRIVMYYCECKTVWLLQKHVHDVNCKREKRDFCFHVDIHIGVCWFGLPC